MNIKNIEVLRDGGTIEIFLTDNTELYIPNVFSERVGVFRDYNFKDRIINEAELEEFSLALSDYFDQLKVSNENYHKIYLIGYIQGYLDCIKVNENENRSN